MSVSDSKLLGNQLQAPSHGRPAAVELGAFQAPGRALRCWAR